jgi:hypothetical protein
MGQVQPLASRRVVGTAGAIAFRGPNVTIHRPIYRLFAAAICAAILLAAAPAPASAQGLFDFLFGNVRRPAPSAPPVHSYADPSDPQRADPGERSAYVGGPAVSYCVRTCDGHFFPIQNNATASPAEICQSLCPAAQTKIFTGSGIGGAYAQDGRRYADLPNAFAYRDKIVSNCSCNGTTPFGLATMDVSRDPTLRQGDIVATYEGLAQVSGGRRGAAQFTPISKSALLRDKRLSELKVAPREQGILD